MLTAQTTETINCAARLYVGHIRVEPSGLVGTGELVFLVVLLRSSYDTET